MMNLDLQFAHVYSMLYFWKTIMKKIIVLWMSFLLSVSVAYAQMNIGQQNIQPVTPTWNQYEFMKYGKIGATLYTGTVNYSIPVYTYRDKDFDIPISLQYATNGYRVNHKSGILGHGWRLSTGGMITREIKGIPDEEFFILPGDALTPNYFYRGYQYCPDGILKDAGVLPVSGEGNFPFTKHVEMGNDIYVETTPDIYSFDFLGYTGCFEANPNCSVNGYRVFNTSGESRGIKVLDVQDNLIQLGDVKGYRYTFKSACLIRKMDSGLPTSGELTDMAQVVSVTTGWHLSRIDAPDSRTVAFHLSPVYNDYNYAVASSHHELEYNLGKNKWTIQGESDNIDTNRPFIGYRLDSISFGKCVKVAFYYEKGTNEYEYKPVTMACPAAGDFSRLKEIQIFKNGCLVKNCRMEYMSTSKNDTYSNTVDFLKSVTISGEGTYFFDYNMSVRAPLLGTTCFDHWGYYNDATGVPFDKSSLFGIIESDDTYEEYGADKYRSPNFVTASLGTLAKITYPTGGYSELFYEPHTYARQMQRTCSNQFYPQLEMLSANVVAGGVRIKKIITNSNAFSSILDTIEYNYSDPNRAGKSSGILTTTPRYGVAYKAMEERYNYEKNVLYYNGTAHLFDYESTPIEYSHVSERKTGEGITDYYYMTSDDFPNYIYKGRSDVIDYCPVATIVQTYDGEKVAVCTFSNASSELRNILSPVCSQQYRRGRLYRTEYRSSDGEVQKKEETEFEYPLVRNDSVLFVVGEYAKWFVFPRYDMNVISNVSTEYSAGVSFTDREQYAYNANGLLRKCEKEESDGTKSIISSVYVGDSISNIGVLGEMVINHVVGEKLEEREYRVKNGIESIVRGERYTYCIPDEMHPSLFRVGQVDDLMADGTWKKNITYRYDHTGNLIEKRDAAGYVSSILWGWDSQYQLAHIDNSTAAELQGKLSAVGIESVDTLAASMAIDEDIYTRLRKLQLLLPQSQVTLYRYKPEYGMTEKICPDASSETFGYDGYGRLNEIRNSLGQVKNQYTYHTMSAQKISAQICPVGTCFVADSTFLDVTVSGGNGHYRYQWTITDNSGNVLTDVYSDDGRQKIFFASNIYTDGQYTLRCIVTDCLSGETTSATTALQLIYRPVEFSNRFVYNNFDEGMSVAGSFVHITIPTTLEFSFSCQTSGQCVLKIGETLYEYSGNYDHVQLQVSASSPVEIYVEINGATDDSKAELTLQNAGILPIGDNNVLTLLYQSNKVMGKANIEH